ncbi:MAG TPA: hypothetical protein VGM56_17705 [Byssovorax sp.]
MTHDDPETPSVLRALARVDGRFAADAERLSRLSRGGSPDLPIEVRSASEVEVLAAGAPCPICRGRQQVLDQTAEVLRGRRLRVATTSCRFCGHRRAMFFRVGSAKPS